MSNPTLRKFAAPALAATGLLTFATAGTAWGAVAEDANPKLVEGNPSCADLDATWTEGKLDFDPVAGDYTRGDLTVTITKAGGVLGWTSNLDIDAVIMKGGDVANVYAYPGDDDKAGNGLVTPLNPNGNDAAGTKRYGISHVTFCYGPETPKTPDAPKTPGTPKTPETPETPKTPETPEAPKPEATATPEPEVQATTATPEVAAAAVAAEPETQVLGVTLEAPVAAAELPRTGGSTGRLAMIGGALIALGGAFLGLCGRPSRQQV
jgi:LPXTG-motif cell wall-anchored protein